MLTDKGFYEREINNHTSLHVSGADKATPQTDSLGERFQNEILNATEKTVCTRKALEITREYDRECRIHQS